METISQYVESFDRRSSITSTVQDALHESSLNSLFLPNLLHITLFVPLQLSKEQNVVLKIMTTQQIVRQPVRAFLKPLLQNSEFSSDRRAEL